MLVHLSKLENPKSLNYDHHNTTNHSNNTGIAIKVKLEEAEILGISELNANRDLKYGFTVQKRDRLRM